KENNVSCNPPCENGGICRPGNLCECTRGYEGIQCDLDIDECVRLRPCDPDYGICENTPGGFHCQCVPGYQLMYDGKHCIDNEQARKHSHLVFRGRGTKGVSVATRLTDSAQINQTKYYPRKLNKRSIQRVIKYSLKSSNLIDSRKRKQFQDRKQQPLLSSRYHLKKLSQKGDPDVLRP
ncbi:unnamed protein product, partial [Schistosoma turkestanicum]